MEALPGTYLLVMQADREYEVSIGRLGHMHFAPGHYLYVGSAFGPGGLKARITHHQKIAQHPHWHVDYLRAALPLVAIWYSHDNHKRECQWATILQHMNDMNIPMKGFGASDCRCASHLFHCSELPDMDEFQTQLLTLMPDHAPFVCETCVI